MTAGKIAHCFFRMCCFSCVKIRVRPHDIPHDSSDLPHNVLGRSIDNMAHRAIEDEEEPEEEPDTLCFCAYCRDVDLCIDGNDISFGYRLFPSTSEMTKRREKIRKEIVEQFYEATINVVQPTTLRTVVELIQKADIALWHVSNDMSHDYTFTHFDGCSSLFCSVLLRFFVKREIIRGLCTNDVYSQQFHLHNAKKYIFNSLELLANNTMSDQTEDHHFNSCVASMIAMMRYEDAGGCCVRKLPKNSIDGSHLPHVVVHTAHE